MAGNEVAADFDQSFAEIIGRKIVAAKGCGDDALWIQFSHTIAESLQFVGRNVTTIANVTFVGEIEIPIGMIFKRGAERFHGAKVGIEIRQLAGGGIGLGGVLARKCDIQDEAPTVAIGDERFKAAEPGFAGMTVQVEGGNGVVERIPGRPKAQPIETAALKVVEVHAAELFGRTKSGVVTEPKEEGGFVVDRETGSVDAEGGLCGGGGIGGVMRDWDQMEKDCQQRDEREAGWQIHVATPHQIGEMVNKESSGRWVSGA